MLKHFFFSSFKRRKEFKALSTIHGEIKTVAIIIMSLQNSSLKITFANDKSESVPFTEKEITAFLKALQVKKESIEESKSVFVLLNFDTKGIHVQQTKKNGEKINIVL